MVVMMAVMKAKWKVVVSVEPMAARTVLMMDETMVETMEGLMVVMLA